MRVRQLTAAAAALLLAAVLGGCSDRPAPARPPAPEPVPEVTAATGDVPPTDRAAVGDGGTLRWAVDRVPATLNVYQPAATADSALLAHALYPSLFRPDGHGRLVPDPDYLAGAESTPPGQQPQVVTYRLNPHAVWSDGTPLTAADLIAQRAALSGLDPAYRSGHPAGYDAIDSIGQGADPREVKVTFRRPCADWPSLFGPLYPAAETSTAAAFNQALAGGEHPSAGPYTVSRYDAEDGRVTVVRNPLWWGDRPKADRIDFLAAAPERRLDALDQDLLDIAPVTAAVDRAAPPAPSASPSAAAPPAAAPEAAALALRRAESLPGITVHRAATASLTQLTLNAARAPLTDPALRLALGRAVDRRRVAAAALTPLGLAPATLGSHLLAGDQDGYRDNSAAAGPADAARLFDEAGWKRPDGGGTRAKDGKALTLDLLVPAGSATAKRTADALTAGLAEQGVALRTVTAPADTFVKDHLAVGDYDLALFSWPAGPSPASEQRPAYAKPRPDPDGTLDPGSNYARSGTEEIDRLFDRAAGELDRATRLDLLQEADVRIWQLGHSVPLYQRPELVGVRSGVAGAGVWGFDWPRFQDVGWSLTS
ncbi:ABC transporter family substrate-binding protein [Kitasatospora sp. NPDC048722]|uniref:ABC transporter family substrate-binding protein n=1 Tax=Kitasatospora sp. NPDC048722 TaxID=3155639 RepID=UPI0034015A16